MRNAPKLFGKSQQGRQRRQTKAARAAWRYTPLIEPIEKRVLLNAASLDSSFGNGGSVVFPVSSPAQPIETVIAVQSDGKLVVAQSSANNGNGPASSVVRRLLADGSPDTSFGSGGTASLPITTDVNDIAIESDGDILVGAGPNLVELTSSGTLDSSFGNGSGVVTLPDGFSESGVAIQSDGKIVVAAEQSGNAAPSLLRLTSAGSLDTSYGSGGIAALYTTNFGNVATGGVAIDGSGRAVVSISTTDSSSTTLNPNDHITVFALERFTSAGQLDTTFGNQGVAHDQGNDDEGGYSPLAIASDGTIYQGDNYDYGSYDETAVSAYTANGSLIAETSTENVDGVPDIGLASMQVDSSGRLVVGGFTTDGSNATAQVVLRFNPATSNSLTLDDTFNGDGLVEISYGNIDYAASTPPGVQGQSVVIKPTGQIDLAGLAISGAPNPNGPPTTYNEFTVTQLGGSANGGSISGVVYDDANGDGTQENGETGLAGVTVYLDANNDGKLDLKETSTTTASDGSYTFSGLLPGNYLVRVVPTGNQVQTSPANGYGQHVTLTSGSSASGENFGLENGGGGSVSGAVQTSSGAGVSNVTVYLDADNNSMIDGAELSTTTSSSGSYSFTSVPPGAYIVRQILPTGDTQTSPANNYGIHLTVSNGSTFSNENFTDTTGNGGIDVIIYNDVNGNGKVDAGDQPVTQSYTLYLDEANTGHYQAGDPEVQSAADGSGTAEFTNLAPGNYIVRLLLPAGVKQTSPSNNYGIHLTVTSGQAESATFLVQQPPAATITGTVYDDKNGDGMEDGTDTGVSDVTVFLDTNNDGVFDGNDPSTITGGDGSYEFTDLLAGNYIVRIVPTSGYQQSSPAHDYGQHVSVAAGQTVNGANFGETPV